MSLQSSLASVRSAVIAASADMNVNNCSIEDESVFDYVQQSTSTNRSACLVAYGGMGNAGRSEFSSSMVEWRVLINAFFMLLDQSSVVSVMNDARDFVDDIVEYAATNSTLDGSVLGFKVSSGSPPLTYRRGNYNYILVALSCTVIENVS